MQSQNWISGGMPSHTDLLKGNIGSGFDKVDLSCLLFIYNWASHF